MGCSQSQLHDSPCSQTFYPGEDLALLWFTCLAQEGEILGEAARQGVAKW